MNTKICVHEQRAVSSSVQTFRRSSQTSHFPLDFNLDFTEAVLQNDDQVFFKQTFQLKNYHHNKTQHPNHEPTSPHNPPPSSLPFSRYLYCFSRRRARACRGGAFGGDASFLHGRVHHDGALYDDVPRLHHGDDPLHDDDLLHVPDPLYGAAPSPHRPPPPAPYADAPSPPVPHAYAPAPLSPVPLSALLHAHISHPHCHPLPLSPAHLPPLSPHAHPHPQLGPHRHGRALLWALAVGDKHGVYEDGGMSEDAEEKGEKGYYECSAR